MFPVPRPLSLADAYTRVFRRLRQSIHDPRSMRPGALFDLAENRSTGARQNPFEVGKSDIFPGIVIFVSSSTPPSRACPSTVRHLEPPVSRNCHFAGTSADRSSDVTKPFLYSKIITAQHGRRRFRKYFFSFGRVPRRVVLRSNCRLTRLSVIYK